MARIGFSRAFCFLRALLTGPCGAGGISSILHMAYTVNGIQGFQIRGP